MNPETQDFIRKHWREDVHALALAGCRDRAVDFSLALQQIQGMQKAEKKLPAHFAAADVLFPPSLAMEQCSSWAAAQYKASLLQGDTLVDLTGGFGVDTFAFARRFSTCVYVEPQQALCETVRHNAKAMHVSNVEFCCQTMEDYLRRARPADCLFADPSRRDSHGRRVVSLADCTPDIERCKETLLALARNAVMVKLSPMLDIRDTLARFPETAAVHVVSVEGECRELLLLLSHEPIHPQQRPFVAADIRKGTTVTFRFTPQEETDAHPLWADSPGKYLYEPNAALMKAGAFRSVAVRFELRKLHPNSHLYTSDKLHPDFPGRVFEVTDAFTFGKKQCAERLKGIVAANVAVRNFPLTASELQRRLSLNDGGEHYIFGTTFYGGQKMLLRCRKVPPLA